MEPRTFLRLEGFAIAVGALLTYLAVDGPLWLFLVLAFAPDLSMGGYLAGPRVGARSYNIAHTYLLPLAIGGVGLWATVPLAVQVAAIWVTHIGVDRLLGYGLKFPTGFTDTHLNRPASPNTPSGDSAGATASASD